MLASSVPPPMPSPIQPVTAETFQANVLMASMQRPVLAYFTASWCGPCKQLRPALEQAVMALGGKAALAVIDIDQNPDLAAAMRVQSVPQVYAFVAGQPVDGFMGAVPRSQIDAFLKKLLAMTGQGDEAADADEDPFAAALALWRDGNLPAAMAAYKAIETDKDRAQKAVEFLKGLVAHAAAAPSPKAQDAPGHHGAAMAALAGGDLLGGFEGLLASIKADRKWQEEKARQDFVALSLVIGLEQADVIAFRKKLSAILFA